ncbi:MAG: hypothetical protein FWC19_05225 [Treponema sp.]|nr:hypothetical protein [Treponema sp.]MCL2272189.1 hypothetical protein [Treponema sp.]
MSRKKPLVIIIVLILFAGLIALTQESDLVLENTAEKPRWVLPLRWFISNSGGMALDETPTRAVALRNEYALCVEFVQAEKLPVYLYPYYENNFFIESRMLYENGRHIRTQWILRDARGTTRVVGVFLEPAAEYSDDEEIDSIQKHTSGFIEIFNGRSFLVSEYRFFKDGGRNRIDYSYKNDLLISNTLFVWEEEDAHYREIYTDFLRYNRSLFLRAVERVFYKDSRISLSGESLFASFPRNLADAAHIKELIGEKINTYPGFFGEANIYEDEKIIYTTDDRSRITTQTLYDKDGKIIWTITNSWSGDRIVSTLKKEGNTEQLAEFEYNMSGNRITEKNYRNGILERVVYTEGKTDIEELYFNNIVVLRAIWEDGRKISETRVNFR